MNIESLGKLISKDLQNSLLSQLPEGHRPLWQYWKEFVYDYIEIEGRSPFTIKSCSNVLKLIVREGGIMSIEQFNSPRLLKQTLVELRNQRNWAPGTYNDYIKSINTYFRWLESQELIETRKTSKVRKAATKVKEQHTFSDGDIERIMTYIFACDNSNRLTRWRNIVIVQLFTLIGMRRAEILGLEVKDVDFKRDSCVLTVHATKSRSKPRRFTLTGNVLENLQLYLAYRNQFRGDEDITALFVSGSKKSKAFTRSGLQKLLKKVQGETGVKLTCHAFRRFVATRLYKQGHSLDEIANYLGHSRTSTTKKYIDQTAEINNDCAMTMHNILWGPPN